MEIMVEKIIREEEKKKLIGFFRRLQKCKNEETRGRKVVNFIETYPDIGDKLGNDFIDRLSSVKKE
jgi:hypothetical protein